MIDWLLRAYIKTRITIKSWCVLKAAWKADQQGENQLAYTKYKELDLLLEAYKKFKQASEKDELKE